MSWSKEQIENMGELDLQREVLVPLFEAMGFRDVTIRQGSGEYGKDIVMWREEVLGERVNYAIVAKAAKLTGKARPGTSAKGGVAAGEVRIQVEEAFGQPYRDPVTGEMQSVDRCWVVSSKEISDEATNAIRSALSGSLKGSEVRFIPGGKLWDLIEEHLGTRTAISKLHAVREIFESISPNYRVTSHITGDGVTLSLEPKHEEASVQEPIEFQFQIAFPNDEEGRKNLAAWERHRQTGCGVVISKKFIRSAKLPQSLRSLEAGYDEHGDLAIGPARNDSFSLVRLEIVHSNGEIHGWSYFELETVQIGTDEITMANPTQRLPLKFVFRLNRTSGRITVNLMILPDGHTASVVQKFYRLLDAINAGGILRLVDVGSERVLLEQTIAPGLNPCAPHIRALVEDLALIEQSFDARFVMPTTDVDTETESAASDIAAGLRFGVSHPANFTVQFGAAELRGFFETRTTVRLRDYRTEAEARVQLLGQSFNLGSIVIECPELVLDVGEAASFLAGIEGRGDADKVNVRIVPTEPGTLTVTYRGPQTAGDPRDGQLTIRGKTTSETKAKKQSTSRRRSRKRSGRPSG